MKIDHDTLGWRVRSKRLWRQHTLADITAKTGIPRSRLSMIERNRTTVRPDELLALADALGVTVGWIVGERTSKGVEK